MTLQEKFQEIQKNMAQQMPQEILTAFGQSLAQLMEQNLEEKALKQGDIAPDFTLPAADGTLISLYALLKKQPVILNFFRGNWCPFCTTTLNHYQTAVSDGELKHAALIFLSPQRVEFNQKVTVDNKLTFPLLSDQGNSVAEKYGLVFTLQENMRDLYKTLGADLSLFNGDASWHLPIPATYVIGKDKRIIFAAVNSNYMERSDIHQVLDAMEM